MCAFIVTWTGRAVFYQLLFQKDRAEEIIKKLDSMKGKETPLIIKDHPDTWNGMPTSLKALLEFCAEAADAAGSEALKEQVKQESQRFLRERLRKEEGRSRLQSRRKD